MRGLNVLSACALLFLCGSCIHQHGAEVQMFGDHTKPISRMADRAYANDAHMQEALAVWFDEQCSIANIGEAKACAERLGMTCMSGAELICRHTGAIRTREIEFLLHMPLMDTASPWSRTITEIVVRYTNPGPLRIEAHRSQPDSPIRR